MFVDAHCHAYDLPKEELEKYRSYAIIGVSEDYESSLRTIDLSAEYENIVPFIGLHPWNVYKTSETELEKILALADRDDVKGLGEIGIDKRIGKAYQRQREVFERFCEVSYEYDLPLSVHALDSWSEVLEILRKHDVEKAVFHWYSGPTDLLEEIAEKMIAAADGAGIAIVALDGVDS